MEVIVSLSEWERNGWLVEHTTSPQEIRDLLAVVERDLNDSAAKGLSADWRLNIAYNAGLQAATAALAACGYRATRDNHHYRVIDSLPETIGADAKRVATFDAYRKKRNVNNYERIGLVSDAEADGMRELAVKLRDDVMAWLEKNHPKLLEPRRKK